jgi:hypothetical protein
MLAALLLTLLLTLLVSTGAVLAVRDYRSQLASAQKLSAVWEKLALEWQEITLDLLQHAKGRTAMYRKRPPRTEERN